MLKKTLSFLSKYNMLPVAAILFIVTALVNKDFLREVSIMALLFDVSVFGFLVLGQALVVLTGGIDISVGNMASMASVVSVWTMLKLNGTMSDGLVILLTILITLAFCGLIGMLTGMTVTYLKITPLIATLGAMWVVLGIGYFFLKGVPTTYPIFEFSSLLTGNISFIPYAFIALCLVIVVFVYLLNKVKWGRSVYAVGGNEYASYISGIKVNWIKISVYIIAAVLAAITGLLVGAYSSVGYPRACTGYEMFAIAAIVMGGIPFSGGEGNIWNAFFAIFALRILNKLVLFSGLSGYIEGMVVGGIILLTLILNARETKLSIGRVIRVEK